MKSVPIWVYGTAGLFFLLKLYMDQKWTHWQKIGLKGPAPSLMAWGNGGLFMEMLANKTDPFEYVEKYGNVSGKARRTKRGDSYNMSHISSIGKHYALKSSASLTKASIWVELRCL